MELIKTLKALADENRLRILHLLNKREMCVCEIENVLGITQSNASRHLIKLKEADVIESEKQGHFVFYKINDAAVERFPFIQSVLEMASGIKKFHSDLEKLGKLEASGGMCERRSCKG